MRAPVSEVSSCDYSNHLDINSAWKSVVASCVCVCLNLERTFSTRLSPVLVFISSVKHIRFQQQKGFAPAENVFAGSNKRVRLQCDLYLEVSSRDYIVAYLIASDECAQG